MPEKTQTSPETRQDPTSELVQFADGRLAIGYRTQGDVISWDGKYTDFLEEPGVPQVAIVTMDNKAHRFAIGNGIVIKLPQFDLDTGKFSVVGGELPVARLEDLAPGGLPDLTIGENWAVVPGQGKVAQVLVDYKKVGPQGHMHSHQMEGLNPFTDAERLLQAVSEKLGHE